MLASGRVFKGVSLTVSFRGEFCSARSCSDSIFEQTESPNSVMLGSLNSMDLNCQQGHDFLDNSTNLDRPSLDDDLNCSAYPLTQKSPMLFFDV
ncbi:unnamed protein product [Heligmosomoides polygyrus]|uniref:Ovule protein n=1 Tax=Heligmosomoides polygyrus TaxID=6339 RepID=A0A183GU05_HELPZ|nr:unnamed protein product [Heligmosomoides polygyrus]